MDHDWEDTYEDEDPTAHASGSTQGRGPTAGGSQGYPPVPERECFCGIEAKACTSKAGRAFLCCFIRTREPGSTEWKSGCKFFAWVDEEQRGVAAGPARRCYCELQAKSRDSKAGRTFFSCPVSTKDPATNKWTNGCKFFEWADEAPRGAARAPAPSAADVVQLSGAPLPNCKCNLPARKIVAKADDRVFYGCPNSAKDPSDGSWSKGCGFFQPDAGNSPEDMTVLVQYVDVLLRYHNETVHAALDAFLSTKPLVGDACTWYEKKKNGGLFPSLRARLRLSTPLTKGEFEKRLAVAGVEKFLIIHTPVEFRTTTLTPPEDAITFSYDQGRGGRFRGGERVARGEQQRTQTGGKAAVLSQFVQKMYAPYALK